MTSSTAVSVRFTPPIEIKTSFENSVGYYLYINDNLSADGIGKKLIWYSIVLQVSKDCVA